MRLLMRADDALAERKTIHAEDLQGLPMIICLEARCNAYSLFSYFGGGTLVDKPEQFLAIGVGAWRMRIVALRECCSNRIRLAYFRCEHPRVLRSCDHRHGQRQAQWRRLR